MTSFGEYHRDKKHRFTFIHLLFYSVLYYTYGVFRYMYSFEMLILDVGDYRRFSMGNEIV